MNKFTFCDWVYNSTAKHISEKNTLPFIDLWIVLIQFNWKSKLSKLKDKKILSTNHVSLNHITKYSTNITQFSSNHYWITFQLRLEGFIIRIKLYMDWELTTWMVRSYWTFFQFEQLKDFVQCVCKDAEPYGKKISFKCILKTLL